MSRDSIHVTMTAQLRQAQVRQRLEALAANTALPSAHLAGRALAIGLSHIEHDYRLIFPAASTTELPTRPATAHTAAAATELPTRPATAYTAAAPATELPSRPATAHTAAAPATELLTTPAPTYTHDTAAAPATELLTTRAPTHTQHTTTAAAAGPETAQAPMMQAESTPPADRPHRIPSQAAARALKKTLPAFQAHLHRHPELKRHSEIVGRLAMWDLAGLRADWNK